MPPDPVLPAFGPVRTAKLTVAPAIGAPPALCAMAVTVWSVPTGLVAVAGDRPTVENSVGSGATSTTGDRMRSAIASLPAWPLSQHENPIALHWPPEVVVGAFWRATSQSTYWAYQS